MSEEPKEEEKEKTVDDLQDIVVKFDGLDKLEEQERNQVEQTITTLSELVKQQDQRLKEQEARMQDMVSKQENEKKEDILNRLKDAGYSTEPFEKLDLTALQAATTALSETDKEFIVPRKKDKPKIPATSEPQIWNPVTKKYEPFHGSSIEKKDD